MKQKLKRDGEGLGLRSSVGAAILGGRYPLEFPDIEPERGAGWAAIEFYGVHLSAVQSCENDLAHAHVGVAQRAVDVDFRSSVLLKGLVHLV